MAREFICPRCGEDITDSHVSDEPDVGITGGYYCDNCQEGYPDEPEDFDD